jgi:hypothetical protein
VAGHVPFRLAGQRTRLAYRIAFSIDALHEYILAAGVSRKKGQMLSIGSDRERMLVGFAKEVSHRVVSGRATFGWATVTATLLSIVSNHACLHENCI